MPKRTRQTPLTGKTKDGQILTPKQEKFCMLYVETMGNGTEAAIEAHNLDPVTGRGTAKTMACENLAKPKLLKRIDEILGEMQLNDTVVDQRLAFNIHQRMDISASNTGINIYNKMKGRFEKDNKQKAPKIEVNIERKKEISRALKDI